MTHDQTTPAPVEVTLKPCPFCGGEATISSESCGWRVDCLERDCYTRGPWPDDCTEAEAIAAWNTRHSAPAGEVVPRTIYVQWADNGNIRKWDWSKFELAEQIKVETLDTPDAKDAAPFDWNNLFLGAFGAAANADKRKPGSVDEGAAYLRKHIETAFVPVDWYVKVIAKMNSLRTHPAPPADLVELVEAFRGLIDDEPCRYDHHGYCQAHYVTSPCEMATARTALAKYLAKHGVAP